MRIFAISDLHLSLSGIKPMDVFGPRWANHAERIATAWRAAVRPEDLVLLAGDFCWAMRLPEAEPDLAYLRALPGTKVMVKGNHDYWWQGVGKARKAVGEGIHLIQNDACTLGAVTIGGTRLWDFPYVRWPMPEGCEPNRIGKGGSGTGTGDGDGDGGRGGHGGNAPDDDKVRASEVERLRRSLGQLDAKADLRIAMVHYPPIAAEPEPNALTAILEEFRVDLCVYGHVHQPTGAGARARDCTLNGIRYVLTSCDWLDFAPLLLHEGE